MHRPPHPGASARRYVPSMPMVRELALARLGEAALDDLAREACVRRGLLARDDTLTVRGAALLSAATAQFRRFERGPFVVRP
ncbi:hypothetical protein [Phenylobacterium sp.]|uniref:hypothetical protein n=1 Tax=Phenylobacterium sp. TaxID=1871053 RepID=UPI0025DD3EFC|nr:hypothetical protein [Phenylobacterium sp.]MBX3482516.1 hypothetical protein [Phenylobacterium sp.]MCW5758263.1 hypothetical protein [Phenylobacterium sp.]